MLGCIKLLVVLYQIRLLSPTGLFRLMAAIYQYGINLMTLLKIAEKTYGDRTALQDEIEAISYKQLLSQAELLFDSLQQSYHLTRGHKVAFLCRNHASLVKSIFAVSLAGSDIYLLNIEMSLKQFDELQEVYDFDLLIYDGEWGARLEQSSYDNNKIMSYHDHLAAVNNLHHRLHTEKKKRRRTSSGRLMLLTGGTTGKPKRAAHKPSLFHYLNPLSTLLTRLDLIKYRTTYIATPIYHGYGMAILMLSVALGKQIVITPRFEAAQSCHLIRKYQVEVVSVVPLMIDKMLKHNDDDLSSLACIASGGAELNPKLVSRIRERLGNVLYNLYGTSETGLNTVATPQDLSYSANTIGKKVKGVSLHILDHDRKKVATGVIGQLWVRQKWSINKKNDIWKATGDLGYQDQYNYYFLRGRIDDMVVSAGENVYPIEVEQILRQHPLIEDAAVKGIADEQFGYRLEAYVQPCLDSRLTEDELIDWLRPRVARYQMPKQIVLIADMPYTHLGKRDKKQLHS